MKASEFTSHLQKVVDHFKEELAVIRSGRATSALVEDVKVEAYAGSLMSLRELASITVPDPTVIIITPWDTSTIPAIEKALRTINGASFNPVADKSQLRLPIPPLSEERRREMVKVVRMKLEDARVAIRNIRQDEMKTLDEEEENGAISKDERFKTRETVEIEVKKFNSHLEDAASKKEQELLRI
ncbi:MAG: ribosome-recycling factor [candidate division WWE3 bacterium]|nr:ribosome-recycling factor [candidate division WWE3 bacterium]